jgi:ABC-type transporter Mla subunit MlaD
LDGLKRAADAAERTFKTHADRFGHADEALANALSRLRDGVEQVTKATQGVFAEYETHITSAVGSLSAVAGELQETVEELAALRRPLPG